MSRMNTAWSNSDQWVEAVPDLFKQPMTIAFGGAVLAHAIFFLGLPVVAGVDKQPDVQPVATTILTPSEQSQVPVDLTQTPFPSGTMLPNSNGLTIPALPTTPTTPTTPGDLFGANSGSSFGPSSSPFFPSVTTPSSGSSSTSDSADLNARLAEIAKKQEEARQEQEKQQKIAQQKAAENAADETQATTPIGPLPPVAVNQMPPGTPPGSPQQPATTPPQTQTPEKEPIRLSDRQLIAENPGFYAFNSEKTGAAIGVGLQKAIAITGIEIVEALSSKPESRAWESLKQAGSMPIQWPKKDEIITLPYPRQVHEKPVAVIPEYRQKLQENKGYGIAIVVIAIDRQGKLASEPTVSQSTGYKMLDDYAIEQVKSPTPMFRMFPVTGKERLYFMKIRIDPPVSKPVA